MGQVVVSGATLQCVFGAAPGTLTVLPSKMVQSGTPVAVISDNIPFTNIGSFGMCSSLANPTVASATSAASGVLTPQACTPVVPAPWTPGAPTVMVGGVPALGNDSSCMCAWAGRISITYAGQATVTSG